MWPAVRSGILKDSTSISESQFFPKAFGNCMVSVQLKPTARQEGLEKWHAQVTRPLPQQASSQIVQVQGGQKAKQVLLQACRILTTSSMTHKGLRQSRRTEENQWKHKDFPPGRGVEAEVRCFSHSCPQPTCVGSITPINSFSKKATNKRGKPIHTHLLPLFLKNEGNPASSFPFIWLTALVL